MDDWQGGGSSKKKQDKKKPSFETKASPITPRQNETEADGWRKGKKNLSAGENSNLRNRERWNWVPEKVVNWLKVGYYAKLSSLVLLLIVLVGIYAVSLLWHSRKTQVIGLQPTSSSEHWLGGSHYLTPPLGDLFEANKDLRVEKTIDLVDGDFPKLKMSGPDNNQNLVIFYLRATGFTFADETNPGKPDLTPYLLRHNARPFDYRNFESSGSGFVPLEKVLDRIAEARIANAKSAGENDLHQLVILDVQSVESPTNPSTFVDWFPKAVEELYSKKKEGDYSNMTLVVSHRLGEKNWPKPENGSTVFGHFARLALLGAADGAIDGKQDKIVSLEELDRYVLVRSNEYVSEHRESTQRPFILTTKAMNLAITVCPSSVELRSNLGDLTKSVGYLTVCDQLGLNDKWGKYEELKEILNEFPYFDARAVAVLSRMEQLCLDLVDSENAELKELKAEWENLFEKSFVSVIFDDAISLREYGELQKQPWPSDPEQQELKDLFLLANELNLPESSPETKEVAVESSKVSVEPLNGQAETGKDNPDSGQDVGVSDDVKKKKAKYDELTERYGKRQRQIVWKLWDECLSERKPGDPAVTKEFLRSWLSRLDDPSVNAKDLMEAKYLQLLLDNVDWDDPDRQEMIQRCVQLSIKCRDLSEEMLVKQSRDSRALLWISDDLETVTNQIRIGEDHLFAADYEVAIELLQDAMNKLESEEEDSIRWRAGTIVKAITYRDRVFREAPHVVALLARHKLRPVSTSEPSEYLNYLNKDSDVVDLISNAHELSDELSNVGQIHNIRKLAYVDNATDEPLNEFKKSIANHCNKLLDQKVLATFLDFAPQLITCPLVKQSDRQKLRKVYNDKLNELKKNDELDQVGKLVEDDGSDAQVQNRKMIEDFKSFLAEVQKSATPKGVQNPRLAELFISPYVNDGNQLRFSQQELSARWDAILKETVDEETVDGNSKSLDESLKKHLIGLSRQEHWFRAAAPILAENYAYEKNDRQPDPYDKFQTCSDDLDSTQQLNYQWARAKRTIDDFWGDNGKQLSAGEYYYERIANRIRNRLLKIQTESKTTNPAGRIQVRLEQAVKNDLAELRAGFGADQFSVNSEHFEFDADEKDAKSHPIDVHAGTAESWKRLMYPRVDANKSPVVSVQVQKGPENEVGNALSIKWINDGTQEIAGIGRLKIPLGDDGTKDFKLSPSKLSDVPRLTSVLAFRGHLATKNFDVDRKIRPIVIIQKPTFIDLPLYTPDKGDSEITVRGGEKAMVDIMFVFDCSSSMVAGDKFKKIRGALENVLQNIDPESFRIGLVAIGNRVFFQEENGKLTYKLKYAEHPAAQLAEKEGRRPYQDAYVVHHLQPFKDQVKDVQDYFDNLKPHGYTPLYLGMGLAAKELVEKGSANQRLVIAITDGVEFISEDPKLLDVDIESEKNLRLLENKFRDNNNIQFHFIGYGIDQDEPGVKKLKSLCGDDNFIDVKTNEGLIEERLEAITSKPKFAVYQSKPDAKRLLEMAIDNDGQPWRFDDSGPGEFRPGTWTVRPVHAWRSFDSTGTDVYLYGGEKLEFELDGSSIRLIKDQGELPSKKVGDKQLRLPVDETFYDVHLNDLDLEKTEIVPIRFEFNDNTNRATTIRRPARICLEAKRNKTDDPDIDVTYVLQDVNFDNMLNPGFPCATFRAPELDKGLWEFTLWYQPRRDVPRIELAADKTLKNPEDFDRFGLDLNLKTEVSGDRDKKKTVTVKLTLPEDDFAELDSQKLRERINKLRSLIVDIQVKKNENGEFFRDFKVKRQFSTELLKTPVELDPKKLTGLSLSATHTFTLADDFDRDTYLVVQSIENAFQKSDIKFDNVKVTK